MATQEKYQGWANWETWNVALWFGNDQGLYHAVREHPTKFTAASAKAFTKEMFPNGTPDFKSPRSYSKVDWKEIADDFNEMRGDGVSETRGAWHPRVRAVEDERPYVRWEVIVGNVGTVFDGTREAAARLEYKNYVILSKSGNGRAGGESVTLMKNGEPVDEHFGSNEVSEMHAAPSANPLSGPRKDARDRAIDRAVEKVRQSGMDYSVWMDPRGEFHIDPATTAPWKSTIAVAHTPNGHLSYKRHGTSEALEAVHERPMRPMRAPLREHPYPPPSRRPARPLSRRR